MSEEVRPLSAEELAEIREHLDAWYMEPGPSKYSLADLAHEHMYCLLATIVERDRALRSWAQMVHQGYHTDQPGTWETCPKTICEHARRLCREGKGEGAVRKVTI